MEQYEVKITEYALEAMRGIAHYIAYDLFSPQAAVNTLNAIRAEIKSLDTLPSRVALTDDEPWHSEGIHKMPVNNYLVYFWINEDEHIVHVTNVVYARRDQKSVLQDMPLK